MNSPYNLGRYNLVGFNVTPINNIFTKVKVNDYFSFTVISTTSDVFPTAKLYIAINVQKAVLVPGKFAAASISNTIVKSKAELIGYSWRTVTVDNNFDTNLAYVREFWRQVTFEDALSIERAILIGCSWRTVSIADEIDCIKADVLREYWKQVDILEEFSANILQSSLTYPKAEATDVFTVGTSHLSQQAYSAAAPNSVINTATLKSSNKTFVEVEALDLIDAVCDVLSLETKICVLTVTLRPGQTMIIDANTYNVWIDQQNAVYVHSGDWLDELDRNTQSFVINAASGVNNLQASILYTERYL